MDVVAKVMDIITAYNEETQSIHRSCPQPTYPSNVGKLFEKLILVLIDMSLHSSLPKRRDTTFCVSVFDSLAMQLNAKKFGNDVAFFLTLPSEPIFYFDSERTAGDSYVKG